MKIYFDGGCKPNPGKMEIAVVDENNKVLAYEKLTELGTNNEAEWLALISTLVVCHEAGIKNIDVYGDSSLVVNQANGSWKIKTDKFKIYKEEFDLFKTKFDSIKVSYIPRKDNLAGIHIEEIAK